VPTPDGAGGSDPVPVARSLDAVMAGLGGPNVETIVTVHQRWADVVGSEVVAHARPVSVEGGCLRVAVDSPGWANHLRWAEADILARVAVLVGTEEITSITVRVAGR
jgi:predicted nucleic acid-binding Zn ribbon protein